MSNQEGEAARNNRTFRRRLGDVILRETQDAQEGCAHIYIDPDGREARAVVNLNTATGVLTISFAHIRGAELSALATRLWGEGAWCWQRIAWSPRGEVMTPLDRELAAFEVNQWIQGSVI